MQYLIMATETQDAFEARDDPDRAEDYWAAWTGYIAALTDSGVLVAAAGLQPPTTATTVRRREGRRLVQDGPFADTKEQLGGYFGEREAAARAVVLTGDPAVRAHLTARHRLPDAPASLPR